MCERRSHPERKEHDPGDHREMQIRVCVSRQGDALLASVVHQQPLHPDREEIEIRQPERCRDQNSKHRRNDHLTSKPSAPGAQPDRNERLAEHDDHNQAVPLGEMREVDPPAAHANQDRPNKSHRDSRQPQHGPQSTRNERRDDDQRRAGEGGASRPQHSRQQIRLGPPCHRKQPDEHDLHDQKRQSEDEAMTAERFRDCERGDKQRRGCDKHHRQHDPVIRVDCVRQPGIARPCPPQNRHNEQPATEPTPRRIIHQQGRHLRKREHEHEVEEELGRRHPVVQLGVKLGHNPTLTRTRWRRETNRWIHLSHEYPASCSRSGLQGSFLNCECGSVPSGAFVRLTLGALCS